MVAAQEQLEQAGGEQYHGEHMGAIFKEGFSFSGYERDFLALNSGDGKFLDISGVSGVDSISDGRGSVFADFDNDGDSDIFLTTAQRQAHFLFRNNVGNENRFLRVELEGTKSGRDAFGTVVRVKSSVGVQTKVKAGGSGYISQHDPRLLFGLGSDERAEWVEVVWPGGATRRIEQVPADTAIRIVEGRSGFEVLEERRICLVDPLSPEEAKLAGLGLDMGRPFPDLALRTASGERTGLHALLRPGRRTLVNLWATWCVPCAREMPELERLYPELEKVGVDLVGISVDLETRDEVPGYLRSRSISYPIYTTDEAGLETLYPSGTAIVPLTLLLDDRGGIVEIFFGWSARSEETLRRLVSDRGGP